MKKPILVIMAAGMGSRYGGLKQIDPVDEYGNIIMDYSIFDAKAAGFEEVVFVIKKENYEDFKEAIGDRISKNIKVHYAFQELTDLPAGYSLPAGRIKPFGTGHAVLAARKVVAGPFAVINADDFYGSEAFKLLYNFLTTNEDTSKYQYCMVGYQLKNTVTETGYVSRGVCSVNEKGELTDITERTRIEKREDEIAYTLDEGKTYTTLSPDTMVSMNFWGFSESMMAELEKRFPPFLEEGFQTNPLKCEYYLPQVASELLKEGKAKITVLSCVDKWYGVTYQEDKEMVVEAIKEMKTRGIYKESLW